VAVKNGSGKNISAWDYRNGPFRESWNAPDGVSWRQPGNQEQRHSSSPEKAAIPDAHVAAGTTQGKQDYALLQFDSANAKPKTLHPGSILRAI
jgi:hypothetical protein